MPPLLILPIIAFLILLVLFALVLRRAGRFVAATRDTERFRRQVDDLATRIETSLGQICERVDSVRRGQIDAGPLGDDIAASLDAVGKYADEARALRPPRDGRTIRDDIVGELERAGRALQMIEHGRAIQASVGSAGREIEAQTSIKRGYLNVLHAREAIAHHASLARGLGAGDEVGFERRNA
jgi:hypothetical protein